MTVIQPQPTEAAEFNMYLTKYVRNEASFIHTMSNIKGYLWIEIDIIDTNGCKNYELKILTG